MMEWIKRSKVILKKCESYIKQINREAEAKHDNVDDIFYMDISQYEIMKETNEILKEIDYLLKE